MAPAIDTATAPARNGTVSDDGGPFAALRASRNGVETQQTQGPKTTLSFKTTQDDSPDDSERVDKGTYKWERPAVPNPLPWPAKQIPIPVNLNDLIAWTEVFVVQAGKLAREPTDEISQIVGKLQSLLLIYFGSAPSSKDTWQDCVAGLEANIKDHLDAEEDVSHALNAFTERRQWGYPNRESGENPIHSPQE